MIDTYNLADNNCTTLSCEGVKAGTGLDILYTKDTNHPKSKSGKIDVRMLGTPSGALNDLKKQSEKQDSGIVDVTDKYKPDW